MTNNQNKVFQYNNIIEKLRNNHEINFSGFNSLLEEMVEAGNTARRPSKSSFCVP